MADIQIKLSLGCGRDKEDGFIGLDCANYGWNKVWIAPDILPFKDDEVDFIKAENFIEHLDREDALKVFNECWRVLRPTGWFEWTAPDAGKSIDLALSDPTHKSLWVRGIRKYLLGIKPRNADYGIKKWAIENDGKGNYTWEIREDSMRVRLFKR